MAKALQIKVTSNSKKYISFNGTKIELSKSFQNKFAKAPLKKDLGTMAKLVRDKISSNISRGINFKTGGKVAKLAIATIKQKGFSKPLFRTGKMVLGVMSKPDGNGFVVKMKDIKYPKKGKTPGASLPDVMKWTQEGDARRPARPVFGVNEKDLKKIVDLVTKDRIKK